METHKMIVEKGKAGYAALYLQSYEEQRSIRELKKAARELDRNLFLWTVGKGLVHEVNPLEDERRSAGRTEKPPMPDSGTHPELMDKMAALPEKTIVVLRLFHHFLDDVLVQASLMDLIPKYKVSKRMIVVLTPIMKLPPELEKEFALIDLALPSKEEMKPALNGIIKNLSDELKPSEERQRELIEAAMGLTTTEAENAFSLALIRPRMENPSETDHGKLWDPKIVMEEKCQALKRTGILEYIPVSESMDAVGGMDNLKEFIRKRRRAFSDAARAKGLPAPKGVLTIGPPGTGKTLGAKATSGELKLPLLKLDMGKVYGGLVGQSEANIRLALQTAEALAPCILWIDEIEKGMATGSGNTDSGVGMRVLGTVLTWMQEKKAPVFVYATANRANLPAELIRKGRFDEMFSVDLPAPNERKEIFKIHLAKRNLMGVIRNEDSYGSLISFSDLFTGAEIESAIEEAMFSAFDEDRDLVVEDVIVALQDTQPQAKIMAEDIQAIRSWCASRTRPANRGELPQLINVSGRTLEA